MEVKIKKKIMFFTENKDNKIKNYKYYTVTRLEEGKVTVFNLMQTPKGL